MQHYMGGLSDLKETMREAHGALTQLNASARMASGLLRGPVAHVSRVMAGLSGGDTINVDPLGNPIGTDTSSTISEWDTSSPDWPGLNGPVNAPNANGSPVTSSNANAWGGYTTIWADNSAQITNAQGQVIGSNGAPSAPSAWSNIVQSLSDSASSVLPKIGGGIALVAVAGIALYLLTRKD